MRIKKNTILVLLLIFIADCGWSQSVQRNIKTAEYKQLQEQLCMGWNTWYNNSVLSHVLLPEGFAINLCLSRTGQWQNAFIREFFKDSKVSNRDEKVFPGLRSDDGSYTSIDITYKGDSIRVQSATDGEDEVLLVTPLNDCKNQLVLEAGILWNKEGVIGVENQKLVGRFPPREITVGVTEETVVETYAWTSAPHITLPLNNEIGIFSGKERSLDEIRNIIAAKRKIQEERVKNYGDLAEQFQAMQTILAWNTIYDAANERAICPVSRNWNKKWGGFVLFDWDTYFASYMLSLFNKDLAYANAIEITKAITPAGFIPNFQAPNGNSSWDRSQPPIGSLVILQIYNRYHDKWFLEEAYNELLSWNRWWEKNRDIDGFHAWGSDETPDSLAKYRLDPEGAHELLGAKLESGLDNSPMYDDVVFNSKKNVMELADVGLMSFYIADCRALAVISKILDKKKETAEIERRGKKYQKKLADLWDEETGIFLNKNLATGEFSHRLSPTNFYPMLANACSQKQAETMMEKHYFNSNEFYGEYVMPSIARNDMAFSDNAYWRGRIWAPMNFLVYLGMCNYDLPGAKKDLIEKSNALLMKSWKKDKSIYENYNCITGEGDDGSSSDGFYHWGALLSFMSFIEEGYLSPPVFE